MRTRYGTVRFDKHPNGGWLCLTQRDNDLLGAVYPEERNRFAFYPRSMTMISPAGLRDIAAFIEQLEKEVKCG